VREGSRSAGLSLIVGLSPGWFCAGRLIIGLGTAAATRLAVTGSFCARPVSTSSVRIACYLRGRGSAIT
jgi:hypothetical protein